LAGVGDFHANRNRNWNIDKQEAIDPIEFLLLGFSFRDKGAVIRYIDDHPHLLPLILDANEHINRHFPSSEMFLEILIDPDSDKYRGKLILYISTDLPAEKAIQLRERFDRHWWIKNIRRAKGNLCITLEYE
jgi:hypothetical protein